MKKPFNTAYYFVFALILLNTAMTLVKAYYTANHIKPADWLVTGNAYIDAAAYLAAVALLGAYHLRAVRESEAI